MKLNDLPFIQQWLNDEITYEDMIKQAAEHKATLENGVFVVNSEQIPKNERSKA